MNINLVTKLVCSSIAMSATALAQPETSAPSHAGEHDAAPLVASANTATTAPNMVSVMGKLGFLYSGGYGAALRYRHSIVPRGFIKHSRFHDELGIEGGFDYTRYGIDLGVTEWDLSLMEFSAAATWNFWFTEDFAAYPRAGLGFGVASFASQDGLPAPVGYGGIYGVGGVGALYDAGALTLRAEVNNRELSVGGALTF